MADIQERHINIKFCFRLGKTFMETHEMMKNIFMVVSASSVHVVMNGLSDLRTVGSQHMISCIWVSPPLLTLFLLFPSTVCGAVFTSVGVVCLCVWEINQYNETVRTIIEHNIYMRHFVGYRSSKN
jgi:hypothetical protein